MRRNALIAPALGLAAAAWLTTWIAGLYFERIYDVGASATLSLLPIVAGTTALLAGRARETRRAFICLGLGAIAWGAGQGWWTYAVVSGADDWPFPSYADAGYLLALPLLGAGVASWPRRRRVRLRRMRGDAGVGVLVATLVSFEFAIEPILLAWDGSAANWIALAYPVGDLILLTTVVVGLLLHGWLDRGRLVVIAIALVLFVIADTGFAVGGIGESSWSRLLDPGWALGFVGIGVAALLPADWGSTHIRRIPATAYVALLAILLAVVAFADAVEDRREDVVGGPVSYLLAAMFVGVTVRLLLLARERERAAAALLRTQRELRLAQTARDRFLIQLVNAREDEARRISQLLHDDVVQQLTALQLRLELAGTKGGLPQVTALSGATSEIIAAIRRLLVELHPAILDSQGLAPAVDVVADQLRDSGTAVHVQPFPHRLPVEIEVLAYRLIQEALSNVAQHSGASEAGVELRLHGGVLRARIHDNGVGFAAATATPFQARGLGLYVARERVELLGGRFLVHSDANRGTDVVIELPVPAAAAAQEAAS